MNSHPLGFMERSEEFVRERILGITEMIFAELGYHQANTLAIAEAAGVPPSPATQEFKSKQNLRLAVVRQTGDQ